MKKLFLNCALLTLAILYSCKNDLNVSQKYEDLKKTPYNTMSNDQQINFEKLAAENLKHDADFIALNKLFENKAKLILEKRMRVNHTTSKELTQFKKTSDSISTVNTAKLIVYMVTIGKKYPEFGKLDKQVRKRIFNKASKK